MVLEGSSYKYVPDQLTIKAGDVVRFHNVSGGPHNVSFWGDSIPSGAADALKAGMPDQMAPLEGSLLTEPNAHLHRQFRQCARGRVQVLLPAAPRAGYEGQAHRSVSGERRVRTGGRPDAAVPLFRSSGSGVAQLLIRSAAESRRRARPPRRRSRPPAGRPARPPRSASGSTPPPRSAAPWAARAPSRAPSIPARPTRTAATVAATCELGNAAP